MDFDTDWYPTPTDPEWSDLTPIELTEADNKFVAILGTEQYRMVMAYLRALLAAKEYSPRGLKLTDVAIELLPSNYTLWHYRRQCLDAIGGDWDRELRAMIEISKENPKTYQVWQFRRMCTFKLNHPRNELSATEQYIFEDQKNYHVWGYRQWLLRHFPYELSHALSQLPQSLQQHYRYNPSAQTSPFPSGVQKFTQVDTDLLQYLALTPYTQIDPSRLSPLTLDQYKTIPLTLLPLWAHEYSFCDHLLFTHPLHDIRNNSAWNQRMFVLGFAHNTLAPHPHQIPLGLDVDKESLRTLFRQSFGNTWLNEVKIVIDSFTTVTKNESAYNYLQGLCATQYKTKPDPELVTTLPTITPQTPIIAPHLDLIYPAIIALYKFTLTKQLTDPSFATQLNQATNDEDTEIPIEPQLNRFFLSFLVDFLLLLVTIQPPTLFSQDTIELVNLDVNSVDQVSAGQLKGLTTLFTQTPTGAAAPPVLGSDQALATKHRKDILQHLVQLTTILTMVDPLRAKYWTFRQVQIHQRFTQDLSSE